MMRRKLKSKSSTMPRRQRRRRLMMLSIPLLPHLHLPQPPHLLQHLRPLLPQLQLLPRITLSMPRRKKLTMRKKLRRRRHMMPSTPRRRNNMTRRRQRRRKSTTPSTPLNLHLPLLLPPHPSLRLTMTTSSTNLTTQGTVSDFPCTSLASSIMICPSPLTTTSAQ